MNAGRESYAKVLGHLAGLLAGLVAIGLSLRSGTPPAPAAPRPTATRAVVVPPAPAPVPVAVPTPEPEPEPPPAPVVAAPAPLPVDREAVARAEHDLDVASRDRARAEARADDAARRLSAESLRAAAESRAAKALAFRVRDPSARLTRATARGGFLKADRDRLKGEVATLAATPRPQAKVLSNKNPVAKPTDGDEQHFELRRNRVSYLDLDRLIALVKTDAQLRIRLSDGARVVTSRVGPVGTFSLHYSLARGLSPDLDSLLDGRVASYNLRGWEAVPEYEGRGEAYEATTRPISEYARVINRLSPHRSTVTFWVYPDSFTLFRKLRDDLQARGFLVAARPLPDGMAIRGSPGGSLSAGQ